jgi:hypothetical protein
MTNREALDFAREWIAAWNSHDLERILSHYTDDVEMSSPYIPEIAAEPSGTLRGKAKVGAYWKKALQQHPGLHFELVTILCGVDSLALYYRNHAGRMVVEVLSMDGDGRVFRGHAHYAIGANAQAQ